MAYSRGNYANIIVGAAALFTYDTVLTDGTTPSVETGKSFKDTLEDFTPTSPSTNDFRNVGYTTNGLDLEFMPDFGEVKVDQVLDVAKLYKQGMQVNLKTTFAEATLENLLFAIAGKSEDLAPGGTAGTAWTAADDVLNLSAGDIGECPVERGLVAVGPGSGDCAATEVTERIYVAHRALSIENVTVSAKRDEASQFEVSFRLLPDNLGSYGKIVDRVYTPGATS